MADIKKENLDTRLWGRCGTYYLQKKRLMEQTLERRVRVIPATKKLTEAGSSRRGKQRVAAYCRVSTDSEEQLNSYEAQKAYYTQKIEENPDWELAGIFADKGLSGTA